MKDEAGFWQQFEGQSTSRELDAEHWIRVYTELESTLQRIAAGGGGDSVRIRTLIGVFEERLAYWRGVRHDGPVLAARGSKDGARGGSGRRSA